MTVLETGPSLRSRYAIALHVVKAPVLFAIVFAVAQISDLARIPIGFCVFRFAFGMPCPGCGITTSIRALFAGDFVEAIHANAAGPVVLLFVTLQLLLSAAAAARLLPDYAITRYSRLNDRGLFVSLLITWFVRFL